MRKKGLVYRSTMFLGLAIVALQFGGELFYSKYIKSDRNEEIKENEKVEDKKRKFEKEDQITDEDIQNQRKGIIGSWKEQRRARLEKIKNAKVRPEAPLVEELQEKPGYKEIKLRKLVVRSEDAAKEASKDDYI